MKCHLARDRGETCPGGGPGVPPSRCRRQPAGSGRQETYRHAGESTGWPRASLRAPGPARFAGAGQLIIRREDDVPMPRQACELWPVLRFRPADPASAVDRQHAREKTRTASLNSTIRRQVDVKLHCAGCSHAVGAVPEDGLILAARGRRRQQGIAEPEPGKQPDDAHPTQGMNDEPDLTHRPGGYSLEDVCAFSPP